VYLEIETWSINPHVTEFEETAMKPFTTNCLVWNWIGAAIKLLSAALAQTNLITYKECRQFETRLSFSHQQRDSLQVFKWCPAIKESLQHARNFTLKIILFPYRTQ